MASARKLATVCYSVLVNRRPYFDPLGSQAVQSLRGSADHWCGRARDWGCLVASSYCSGVGVQAHASNFTESGKGYIRLHIGAQLCPQT